MPTHDLSSTPHAKFCKPWRTNDTGIPLSNFPKNNHGCNRHNPRCTEQQMPASRTITAICTTIMPCLNLHLKCCYRGIAVHLKTELCAFPTCVLDGGLFWPGFWLVLAVHPTHTLAWCAGVLVPRLGARRSSMDIFVCIVCLAR